MNLRHPLSSLKRSAIASLLRTNILFLALREYRNPSKAISAVRMLVKKREAFSGVPGIAKFFYANGRFFFNPNLPGFPSQSFNKFIVSELNNSLPFKNGRLRLTTLFLSITKKCPLSCRHCLEWDRLDGNETLSVDDLKVIIDKFQRYGVSQIQISGGEPMARFEDLLTLLRHTDHNTDTWLLTSGYNLSLEKARQLKNAGLTGVRISLDHWESSKHNEFRGSPRAFGWAVEASENCRKAGLATGLAICVTKESLSEKFLSDYLEFARSIRASFIFILEPRDTGHFKDSDVRLSAEMLNSVEDFYLRVNSSPEFEDYPPLFFPGYHQRRIGCFGAGVRYLYVDSEGSVHACPFCQGKMGDSLNDDLARLIPAISRKGCHLFPKPVHLNTPQAAAIT
jgi:MoaA/NifB/PqqE/SkfB family radical SAM enzyme